MLQYKTELFLRALTFNATTGKCEPHEVWAVIEPFQDCIWALGSRESMSSLADSLNKTVPATNRRTLS